MELDVETIPAIPLLEAEPIKRTGEVWKNCTTDNDEAVIESVVILPDPPQPGKNLTIIATVKLKEEVFSGEIVARIKFGFLPIHKTFDLCSTLAKDGQTCPLPAGTATNKITQMVPKSPTGHVTGIIKVNDLNKKKEIACFTIDLKI